MGNSIKNFKIPKTFILFGHEYKVVMRNDLYSTKGCYGLADDDLKLILLQTKGKISKKYDEEQEVHYFEVTDETLVETFYHEITHIIFDAIGETKLSEDEALVNMVGKAWLEIYLSSTYEKGFKKVK